MVENPYFQFPLCALAYEQTTKERINAILDYSVVEAGSQSFQRLTAEQQHKFLAQARQVRGSPEGFRPNDWLHRAALYGAEIIGIKINHLGWILDRHKALRAHIAAFEKLHGRDAKVRVKRDWLFAIRNGNGITYREFAVLCAIYSAIGDKKLTVVTQDRIRRCALGYRTAAIMNLELAHRADKAQPLTKRQLRDTIARLHRNKFFARSTVGRRITYYSNRLDGGAMRKKIFERRTYSASFHASQALQDQALTTAIKQKRCEATQSASKNAARNQFKFTLPDARIESPHGNRSVPESRDGH